MTPMPGTNVRALPVRDPLDALPEIVGKAWRRRLSVLVGMEGFYDRVQYASEALSSAFEWAHLEVISGEQFVAMERRLRAVLQEDLGAITADDAPASARRLD